MIKVGLTGNLGSGKTTIAAIFEILGVPVYYADKEAKKFLELPAVAKQLVDTFGEDILSKGSVDRRKLATLVFNNKDALNYLNNIIHPLVKKDLENWLLIHKSKPYTVQEAAILFESGFYKTFDAIMLVTCPVEIAVRRVMTRDRIAEPDVRARLNHQWPEQEKIALSDYLVVNDGNTLVIPQVLEIHHKLSAK